MPLESISTHEDSLLIGWSFPSPTRDLWDGLTDRTLLSQWLGQPIECDMRAGGRLVVEHGEGYASHSDIMEADPPHRLAMTWNFPDEPESRLLFELHPSDPGTRLELTHQDLGSFVGSYGPGWITHLTYLEAAISGTPLVTAQFWQLHATVEALYNDRRPAATGTTHATVYSAAAPLPPLTR
ncbi:SRPBCC domain-containing protein [Arthrobacter sp. Sa2CUA1]|uniref:SRPBCC domain-containing protein n=1 Tax=Arthrobacter gallicola TaxID=2762225 RepID=A0ABR8UMR6_9MICC|nr:SRPBCC domain-containing protein [Arthrobacter gallicola]MBD7993851.1 SRPBCC domain-containing protein [Arthrobacter gallicola]